MIKKLTLIFVAIFLFLFLLSITYNVEFENCTIEEAIKIAQEYVKINNKDTFVNTITNFEVPTVEIINEKYYKVTFNYPLERFTSPYDVYINCKTGKCYGRKLKY